MFNSYFIIFDVAVVILVFRKNNNALFLFGNIFAILLKSCQSKQQ